VKRKTRRRISIRYKVAAVICLASLVLMVVGLSVGYFLGFQLLRDSIAADYLHMAGLLSTALNRIIEEEIDDVEIYMSHPLRKKEIERRNLKYKDMDKDAIKNYFSRMDKEWSAAPDDSPLTGEYLETPVSNRLKILVREDAGISELFMTDKFGGLVASSGKTSDFYQADERWWQKASNGRKDRVFIGAVEFDESSGVLSVPLAVPVRGDSGDVIGVCKAVLDIKRLFAPLEGFKIGETGHVGVVDGKGRYLFHEEFEPLIEDLANETEWRNLLKNKKQWQILKTPHKPLHAHKTSHAHTKPVLIAYELVNNPKLLEEGIYWRVFMSQDVSEVFKPLNILFLELLALAAALFCILLVMGFLVSGPLVRPLKKLHEGIERIGKGELDHKVDITTNDELEDLGDAFNTMAEDLKKSTASIAELNREVSERKSVEEEVERKVKDLETFKKSTVDRELKMIELKKRIKELETKSKRK